MNSQRTKGRKSDNQDILEQINLSRDTEKVKTGQSTSRPNKSTFVNPK